MFEETLIDGRRMRRSPWSWAGLVAQSAATGALFLVPMIHPEVLSVLAPRFVLQVPAPPAPIETVVESQTQSAQSGATSLTPVRQAPRSLAPLPSTPRSVGPLLDAPAIDEPFIVIGSSSAQASSRGPVIGGLGVLPVTPPPRPERKPEPPPAKPVPIGGAVQAANLIHRVDPPYPDLARRARISGVVQLEGIIAKDGTIQRLRLLNGHPLLAKAALDAVRQWRYRPTLLNGVPVEVIAPIDVRFVLSQ